MSAIGTATVWGVPSGSTVLAKSFSGSATVLATTDNKALGLAPLNDEVEVGELSAMGEIVGASFGNRKHTITVEIVPIDPASPGTLATAKTKVVLPEPGAKVTIAGTGITAVDGDWNYIGGGSIQLGKDPKEHVKVILPCAKFGSTPAFLSPVS